MEILMPLFRDIFTQNGLFAVMTVGLIIWQSKTNNDRETRYLDTIDNLSNNVSNRIDNIETDVKEIKIDLKTMLQK